MSQIQKKLADIENAAQGQAVIKKAIKNWEQKEEEMESAPLEKAIDKARKLGVTDDDKYMAQALPVRLDSVFAGRSLESLLRSC